MRENREIRGPVKEEYGLIFDGSPTEPQYQWDTEEEEETEDNTVSYRTNAIRIAVDTEEPTMAKIMAA